MSEREENSDSDAAPEEFTSQQGLQKDEELRKVQRENKARVVREVKERRRKWAEKLTSRPPQEGGESVEDGRDSEVDKDAVDNRGMLPDDIVKLIAASEKKVFSSDSEEEKPEKAGSKKKRVKKVRTGAVILNEIPPPQCLQNSLEFLKKRKMQVPRSSAVLNNSSQALRLLSTSGLLCRK